MIAYLQEQRVAITQHNRARLLLNGHDKFIDLFHAIRKAEHSIHMEYFNFRNDSIARAVFKLLGEKVKEGVEVRAMYDAFGNSSNNQPLKKRHVRQIKDLGIQLVKFDPINFPFVNHVLHCDHRKIVVIDGKVGYTGGMNVADYYIKGLPELGPWRDIHMHIEGEAVNSLQQIFLNTWNKETGEQLGGPEYMYHGGELPDSFTDEPQTGVVTTEIHDSVMIGVIDRVPKQTPASIRKAFAKAIDVAQQSIQIVNPYFVPTHRVKKAIKRALKRGVEVEIMIPLKSDIKFTPDAAIHIGHRLAKRGAKVYLFNEGFHHSKVIMIDKSFCTIGTANLNSRSLRYDYETNTFLFNKPITHELNRMFESDKQRSLVLDKEYWDNRSTWKKMAGWFAQLLTPIL